MPTASSNSIYGLLNSKGKGALSLQTLGQAALGDEDIDENGLPTSPFSSLPAGSLGGMGTGAPVSVQAVQAANIPANFQFTGEFDARNRALLQQETDAGFTRSNTLAQIADQYLQAMRQAEKQQTKGRKSLFASLADRGALGSGAALTSVSEFDTEYNDYLNNLSRGRAADIANAENSYASLLNQLGRQREGLVSQQQQVEEQRRIEEERVRAEAARQAQLEEQRRAQIQQMIEAQQQAAAAAQAAAQAAQASMSYNPISFGGGGGGGGGYAPPPAPSPYTKPGEDNIALPAFGPGVTRKAVESWVLTNIAPHATPAAVNQVIDYLTRAGPNGLPRSDIAWLISQYSAPTSGGDKQYAAGGGRRF